MGIRSLQELRIGIRSLYELRIYINLNTVVLKSHQGDQNLVRKSNSGGPDIGGAWISLFPKRPRKLRSASHTLTATASTVMNPSYTPQAMPSDQFAWTVAGDWSTEHVKKINHGAFGEVHMVRPTAFLNAF